MHNDGVSSTGQGSTGPAGPSRLRPVAGRAARGIVTAPLTGRAWRQVAFCLAGVVLGAPGFALTLALLVIGGLLTISLAGTFPGLLVLVAALRLARRLGSAHRRLARLLLGTQAPPLPKAVPGQGILGRVDSALRDPADWRAACYVLAKLPVAAAGLYILVMAWFGGLVDLSYPLWWGWYHPVAPHWHSTGQGMAAGTGLPFTGFRLGFHVTSWPGTLLVAAVGVATLLLAPWLTAALCAIDQWLIRSLLGPGSLAARVRDLEQTRARAVDDSAATLRRVERDLHDGAQARLVALAMSLGMAKEKLGDGATDADLARARDLVGTAHSNAKEALAELRDLARGIHPPALDSGLEDALSTLAARSTIPVSLAVTIPERPTPAIETIAYFCAAELLANAAKHSAARTVTVHAAQRDGTLLLRVGDNGSGGADPDRGSGLAGLRERVRTVDGQLSVSSPPGGPTLVTVELPMHA
ncbi:MAG TPA: sensor domain-containing protein [Streptosporangiaceae bacterium]|nr:sensor domain-containing protein [Streptosporangiaceae bacterium]